MRFDVAIGNVVSIFDNRDDYEYFLYAMRFTAKTVKFLSPEEWLAVVTQYEYLRKYAQHKYCMVYNNKYFTDQIEKLIEKMESEGKDMSDSTKLLILMSKQLLVISEKLDAISEKIDNIDTEIDTDAIADAINENLEVSVSVDDIDAEEIAEKIIEALDTDNLFN